MPANPPPHIAAELARREVVAREIYRNFVEEQGLAMIPEDEYVSRYLKLANEVRPLIWATSDTNTPVGNAPYQEEPNGNP